MLLSLLKFAFFFLVASARNPPSDHHKTHHISRRHRNGGPCSPPSSPSKDENETAPVRDLPVRGHRHEHAQIHIDENDATIAAGLSSIKSELSRRPKEDRDAFDGAPPDLTGDRHRIMFLRCEKYDAARATNRMLRYWRRRLQYFEGVGRAYLPLTLDGALAGDDAALDVGFLTFLSETTTADGRRGVLYCDPGKLTPGRYSRESMVRCLWYIVESIVLADRPEVQRRGVVLLVHVGNVGFTNVDLPLFRMHMSAITGCLPLRIGKFIIVHPPKIFEWIFPLVRPILPYKVKQRLVILSGTQQSVLDKLVREYGMDAKFLPSDLGGGGGALDYWDILEQRRMRGL